MAPCPSRSGKPLQQWQEKLAEKWICRVWCHLPGHGQIQMAKKNCKQNQIDCILLCLCVYVWMILVTVCVSKFSTSFNMFFLISGMEEWLWHGFTFSNGCSKLWDGWFNLVVLTCVPTKSVTMTRQAMHLPPVLVNVAAGLFRVHFYYMYVIYICIYIYTLIVIQWIYKSTYVYIYIYTYIHHGYTPF